MITRSNPTRINSSTRSERRRLIRVVVIRLSELTFTSVEAGQLFVADRQCFAYASVWLLDLLQHFFDFHHFFASHSNHPISCSCWQSRQSLRGGSVKFSGNRSARCPHNEQ